ncbi:MAG: NifB/NifX family molybdenum-iron cluster-binding protein [Desulfuromonadales bacterium]
MKIAFSSRGPGPEYEIDESFGRAYYLLVYDEATDSWAVFENSINRLAQEKAGIKTASLMIESGVEVVLTGEIGPRAFRHLHQSGIKVYQAASGSVASMLERWREKSLPLTMAANSPGSPFCLLAQPVDGSKRLSSRNDRQVSVGNRTWKGGMR